MKIVLASKSGIRKKILEENKISCKVIESNIDEDQESLLKNNATPEIISKNLAELKSIKVSRNLPGIMVLGADSVVSLDNELINKPKNREDAFNILKKLNNSKHYLISSVCISKNGSMVWNYSYDQMYKESVTSPEIFWNNHGKRIDTETDDDTIGGHFLHLLHGKKPKYNNGFADKTN